MFLSAAFLSSGINMLALIQRHLIPLLHSRSGPDCGCFVEPDEGGSGQFVGAVHRACGHGWMVSLSPCLPSC